MNQKTVLITGASRGIGKAAALAFAKSGYQLIITCLKEEEKLLQVKAIVEDHGCRCLTFVGDMGDYEVVSRLFTMIKNEFGGIDILVCNAGIANTNLLTDLTIEEWNHILSTNLSSAFYLSKHAIPYMLQKQAGKIINISSVWGVVGASMEVAYSASKGGLNAMTKALAKELAPSNIQVNAIACGAIDTDMNACYTEEDLEQLISEIPADRMGRPEEVADFIVQLSNSNSYLTGQVINLDGGRI